MGQFGALQRSPLSRADGEPQEDHVRAQFEGIEFAGILPAAAGEEVAA